MVKWEQTDTDIVHLDFDFREVDIVDEKSTTAIYTGILNHRRECVFGIGDMRLHSRISPNLLHQHASEIKSASIVLIDGNLPLETITTALQLCAQYNVPLWFEPTEVRKAQKILQVPREFWSSLTFLSPNLKELESITTTFSESQVKESPNFSPSERQSKSILLSTPPPTGVDHFPESVSPSDLEKEERDIEEIATRCFAQFSGLKFILLTLGNKGFKIAVREKSQDEKLSLINFSPPVLKTGEIQSVSGAGDCLNAGFISGLLDGLSLQECGNKATACARDSLLSKFNVPKSFQCKIVKV